MSFSETRDNHLLDGRVRLRQPARGYRNALDPVLLAAAAPLRPGWRVVDLGCGVGSVLLCLLVRQRDLCVRGVDVQADMIALARHNMQVNGHDSVRLDCADLRDLRGGKEACDLVVMNPPYLDKARHRLPEGNSHALADAELAGDLSDWLMVAARLCGDRGRLCLIHRADRLSDIMAKLTTNRFGAIEILPIHPRIDAPAHRVILRARRLDRTPLRLQPPLILHESDGRLSAAAERILRHAQAWP